MRKYLSLLLVGCCASVVTGVSYGLITPEKTKPAEELKPPKLVATPKQTDRSEPLIVATAEPIPSPSTATKATNEVVGTWLKHTVASGENMSIIFGKLNLSSKTLYDVMHSGTAAKELTKIKPGGKIRALVSDDGNLLRLSYSSNRVDSIEISKTETGFTGKKASKELDVQVEKAHAVINSSLFLDAKKAGLSDRLIMELANVFGWDVDFALDLREGDEFTVIYEKLFLNGEEVSTGRILAAEFVNQGNAYQAILYNNGDGFDGYFTPEGKSMKRAFLRTPVSYARISSPFNLKRKHPVLNRIRAHKGVDYAASSGTPIRATGNGKVVYRGRKGGYGRVVIIQHGQKYNTLYAHLSAFNSKVPNGSKVKQGQVIGYVGKSGLATGPHLHYEFRVNGVHHNPLTVKLPQAEPLKSSLIADFKQHADPLIAQLEKAKNTLVAHATTD